MTLTEIKTCCNKMITDRRVFLKQFSSSLPNVTYLMV